MKKYAACGPRRGDVFHWLRERVAGGRQLLMQVAMACAVVQPTLLSCRPATRQIIIGEAVKPNGSACAANEAHGSG